MALPTALSQLFEWWSRVYGDHRAVSVASLVLWLGILLVGTWLTVGA